MMIFFFLPFMLLFSVDAAVNHLRSTTSSTSQPLTYYFSGNYVFGKKCKYPVNEWTKMPDGSNISNDHDCATLCAKRAVHKGYGDSSFCCSYQHKGSKPRKCRVSAAGDNRSENAGDWKQTFGYSPYYIFMQSEDKPVGCGKWQSGKDMVEKINIKWPWPESGGVKAPNDEKPSKGWCQEECRKYAIRKGYNRYFLCSYVSYKEQDGYWVGGMCNISPNGNINKTNGKSDKNTKLTIGSRKSFSNVKEGCFW